MSSPHKIVYAAYMLLKAKDDQGLSRPDRFHVKRAQLDYEGSGLSYGTPGEAISFYNKHRKANKPPNNFEVSRIQDLFREWSRSQNDALPIPDQPSLRVYWQQLHDYSKVSFGAMLTSVLGALLYLCVHRETEHLNGPICRSLRP